MGTDVSDLAMRSALPLAAAILRAAYEEAMRCGA